MKNNIIALALYLATGLTSAFAVEVRDQVYPPPSLVRRTVSGVSIKECLAVLSPAIALNGSYMCRISFSPPTDGQATYVYDPAVTLDRPSFISSSSNYRAADGRNYVINTKLGINSNEVVVNMDSPTREAATGSTYKVIRTDAVNELTRVWSVNNLSARSWPIMVWVVPR